MTPLETCLWIGLTVAMGAALLLMSSWLRESRRYAEIARENAERCEVYEEMCGGHLVKVHDIHDAIRTMPDSITAVNARILAQSGVPR